MSRVAAPIQVRGNGSATHNRATAPGELQVTIWGEEAEPRPGRRPRKVAMVLDEDAVGVLLAHLRQYGFPLAG